MLEKIRNNVAHNKIIRGSLIFITLAFVFWGMGIQSMSLFNKNYAIKTNDVEISANQYFRAYKSAIERTKQQFGGQDMSGEMLAMVSSTVENTITQTLTNQSLFEAYASSENIFVDDRTIFQIIKQVPAFQVEGKFDKETYKAVLQTNGYDALEYEEMVAQQVQANLIEILFGQTVNITDQELDTQIKHAQERRDIELLTIAAKDITKLPEATEDELKAIYDENEAEFTIPENRDFKLLIVSKTALANSSSVTDEEVKQYFEDNKDEFFTKPEFKVQQILVKDQETADKVLAIADLAENFNKYVQEFSTDTISKPKDGDMGWLSGDIFGEEFENAVHSAKKGEVATQAVQTVFGFHIFKLTDVKESKLKDFADVKVKIKANLINEKAEAALDENINVALDMVSAGEKLDNIAKELGFKTQEFTDKEETSALSYINTVFETSEGEVSQPIELDYNSTAFVEVTKVTDETVKSFDEVKSVLVAKFNEQKTAELLKEKTDKVLAEVTTNNVTFKQAAKNFKLVSPIKSVVSIARTGNQAKQVGDSIALAAFDASTNRVIENAIALENEFVIVKVLESTQEKITDEQKEQLRNALAVQKTNDLYFGFLQQLQAKYKPQVNQAIIKQIIEAN